MADVEHMGIGYLTLRKPALVLLGAFLWNIVSAFVDARVLFFVPSRVNVSVCRM